MCSTLNGLGTHYSLATNTTTAASTNMLVLRPVTELDSLASWPLGTLLRSHDILHFTSKKFDHEGTYFFASFINISCHSSFFIMGPTSSVSESKKVKKDEIE